MVTLGELHSEQVDMRTMVIVGSSKTRCFEDAMQHEWVYTPRYTAQSRHSHINRLKQPIASAIAI